LRGAGSTRPDGRGALGMLRPRFELPYERGADDILGTVLRAVIVGWLTLPAGGRGTDRDGDVEDITPPDLAPALAEGPENDLTPLCGGRGTLLFMAICGGLWFAAMGLLTPRFDVAAELELPRLCCGRGTLRPAGCGSDRALAGCPPRLAGDVAVLRAIGVAVLCEAATAGDGLAEPLGGVIRLTVGRETVAAEGCAAGKPAFGPSMLARVGDTFGLPILALDRFRKAPGEMLALFRATGSPCSRVFRETAVSAPGRLE
jgi:hypothetical protein